MAQDNLALVVPFFRAEPYQDFEATKREGRPIFKDRVVCEIRIAGDRNFAPVVPAHDQWIREDGEVITYAMRFKDAYARFTEGREQVAHGTPIAELPFLTEAKRAELRALKIYTAEALASLDGKPLSNLGQTGRELKNQAQAYLDSAKGSAKTVALSLEVEQLRAEMAAMRAEAVVAPEPVPVDDAAERDALKEQIHMLTGNRPRGNPSVATLKETLADLQAEA